MSRLSFLYMAKGDRVAMRVAIERGAVQHAWTTSDGRHGYEVMRGGIERGVVQHAWTTSDGRHLVVVRWPGAGLRYHKQHELLSAAVADHIANGYEVTS
jgi:hypothetical protein